MYCHLFQVPTNEIGDYGSDSEEENHEVEHYLKGVYTNTFFLSGKWASRGEKCGWFGLWEIMSS